MSEQADHRSELDRAKSLLEIKRYADARAILEQLAASNPNDVSVLCHLSLARLRMNDLPAALQAADAGVAANPLAEWPHRLRSVILNRQKKMKHALAAAKTAYELAPEETFAVYQYFAVLHDAKKRKQAHEISQRLLEIAPNEHLAHLAAGLDALAFKKLKDAEQHFRTALAIDPESSVAMNDLGVTLLRQGKRTEAIEVLYGAAKTNPMDSLAQKNLKQAAGARVAGTGAAVWIMVQLARIAGGGSQVIGALVVVGALVLAGFWLFSRTSSASKGLSPEVRAYVDAEVRRHRLSNVRVIGTILLVAIGLIWALLILIEPDVRPQSTYGWTCFAIVLGSSVLALLYAYRNARR